MPFSCAVHEELKFHLDVRTRDNLKAGMNAEAAQHNARRRFGNSTLAKERAHEMNIVMWIETLGRDCATLSAACASRRDLPWWRSSRWRWGLARTPPCSLL